MAELQTISAAFDAARLAVAACVFLKNIKDADKTAEEVYGRVVGLRQTLDGVRAVLLKRVESGVASSDNTDVQANDRILECIKACRKLIRVVETKVGGFDKNKASGTALLDKVKIAFRQPAIAGLQTDLEARISALQTELSILQLSDQAHTHATLGTNHEELVSTLSELGRQLNHGNRLLHRLLSQHRSSSSGRQGGSPHLVNEASSAGNDCDSEAVKNLSDTLRAAADLHDNVEKYTAEYIPDDRSIWIKKGYTLASDESSSPAVATPLSEKSPVALGGESSSHSAPSFAEQYDELDQDEEQWPRNVLDGFFARHCKDAKTEIEQGCHDRAEKNLQSAIRYGEMRERDYHIPFDDRTPLQEEVALCFQKQGKYAEAIAKVYELLRDSHDELAWARQHQLLASIYHDRSQSRNGPALSNFSEDIENAEKHAERAVKRRLALVDAQSPQNDEAIGHDTCIKLLMSIYEIRGKPGEANELAKLLTDFPATASDRLGRTPTHQSSSYVIVEDKHTLLINAIKSGDKDLIQDLLVENDLDIERLCPQGKTALMWAIEISDESTVHRLLDHVIGADINSTDNEGLTALHLAASLGLHDMVRTLLQHSPYIDIRDKIGETPLMKAVQEDKATVVQILLHDGNANAEARGVDEWSLLHYAIRLPKVDMIHQLLNIVPALGAAVDRAGKTALHYCADLEFIDQAAALLVHKQHVDVNALDYVPRSAIFFPLNKVPTSRREAMVRLLIEHGAQFDEAHLPPRHRDYAALKHLRTSRRASELTRHDSVSTNGTIGTAGTTSTSRTKLSRIFSARMHMR